MENPSNAAVLMRANAAIARGDVEGFLSHCDDQISWTTVGEEPIHGKDAVRDLLRPAQATPPRFSVDELIEDGDVVVALGSIAQQGPDGRTTWAAYSDVWRFREGRMVELRAFVVAPAVPRDGGRTQSRVV